MSDRPAFHLCCPACAVAVAGRRQLLLAGVGAVLAGVRPGRAAAAAAATPAVEPRQRLDTRSPSAARDIALTLDACGGRHDAGIVALLVERRIPATVFVTARWLKAQPAAARELLAHPDLFELQNHGERHVPAIVGGTVYGMHGPADIGGVEREISGGAQAIAALTGRTPRWYRGAGARYDKASLALIDRLGLRVAGYSLNGDDGATASASTVARRLLKAEPGDIVLAHLNHPEGGTGRGLAEALPVLQQRGLRFVTLSQAAGVLPMTSAVGGTR